MHPMARIAYFQRSISAQFAKARFNCPSCGNALSSVVDRKYLITQLRRCGNCQLMFRTPTDDPANNLLFYENEYTQGFTTELPSDAALADMKQSNFAGTEKCYSYYIGVLIQLGMKPGSSIFDYGCSWGYGSYQLSRAGFEVVSFEVAPSRRRYAHEKLGVRTVDDMDRAAIDYPNHFDCFFSAHVLEHVPSPAKAFDFAKRLLKRDGLFVSFTPNGSDAHRAISPNWSKVWGEVHPSFIDDIFLDSSFKRSPRAVGSSPVINASLPEQAQLKRLNKLDGSELFFAARRSGETWS
jgi:2-polyprenyl-3-methyl-5-hydroxy-6-metoxy-1,4-benzoquinol methylase